MGHIQTMADRAQLLPGGHPLRVSAFYALKPYGPFAMAGRLAVSERADSWGRLLTAVGDVLAAKSNNYVLTAADVHACMIKADMYRDGFLFCSFGKKYSGKIMFGYRAQRFLGTMGARASLIGRRVGKERNATVYEELRALLKENYALEFVPDDEAKRLQKKYGVKMRINDKSGLGMKNGWQSKVGMQLAAHGFGYSKKLRLDGATPKKFAKLRSLAIDAWNAKGQKKLTKQEIYDCAEKAGYKVKATKSQQHLAASLLHRLYVHNMTQIDPRYSIQVRLREAWLEIMLAKKKHTLTRSEIMQGFTSSQMRMSPAVPMFLACLPDVELSAEHF